MTLFDLGLGKLGLKQLRRQAIWLACLLVGLGAGLLSSSALTSAQAPGPACTATPDKTSAPAAILLGETVTITLKVDGTCPFQESHADVILAFDRSGSMDGPKFAAAQKAALAFINNTDPSLVRIGVVAISGVATSLMRLTEDRAALSAAISGLTTERGTNLVDGLEAARRMVVGADARPGANKVIIFLTDGRHQVAVPKKEDIDPVIAAVKAAGITVFAIGLGNDVDAAYLKKIAMKPANYIFSPSEQELEGIYLALAGRIRATALFKTAQLVDLLPANMTYVPGSALPYEPTVSADGRTLTWDLSNVTLPGFEFTYQVRPTQVGTWPTNTSAGLDYVDGLATAGKLVFPIPTVKVTQPSTTEALCVCEFIRSRVPQALIDDAMTHPERYYGWRYLLDLGKPEGPMNPRRECLSLLNRNVPFHPMWNSVIWRVGCP